METNQNITDDLLLKSILSENTIGKTEALNIPAVARCVNLISDTVSMIPIKLYKEEFMATKSSARMGSPCEQSERGDGKRKTTEIPDSRCDLLNDTRKTRLTVCSLKKQ